MHIAILFYKFLIILLFAILFIMNYNCNNYEFKKADIGISTKSKATRAPCEYKSYKSYTLAE